jgi:hypothetical protein
VSAAQAHQSAATVRCFAHSLSTATLPNADERRQIIDQVLAAVVVGWIRCTLLL